MSKYSIGVLSQELETEGFKELVPAALLADLRAARVQAAITSVEAAKTLGISSEMFDDVEAGRIGLSLSDICEYAYAVGAVIEYSVTCRT